jgi:ArsR family transcriptional regulator
LLVDRREALVTATEGQPDLAPEVFAAFTDPTRLAILELLRYRDHCVCHLVEMLDLKQSVISHHVGVLRRAGLITARPHPRDRRWLYYRLNRQALSRAAGVLAWLLDETVYDSAPLPCPPDGAAMEEG